MQQNSANIGYLVTDLGQLFRRVFDRRAAHLGLTRSQWRALKRIHDEEGLTQTALAEQIDMEPIAVGRLVDRLQKAGFVERRSDANDRRCWRLYLLPQSNQLMDAILAVASSLREDSLTDIDPGELDTTMKVLNRIRETLIQLDRESRGDSPAKQA
ncbi:MarR family transcriptional regulator [Pseudoxanthomonas kalamensis DSM 18571]|uniref:MarR family winged helix-turn-helix transcriptional regulator n=1 Tax=Pseudoxanthomonas kalamensis TaxID=289483 RepID=UPI001391F516|nr:MarR family transcriptional regulator [Pseudoxanthomonas kalamensis]KAF1711357.1 MarR family transcriptional regulator [Pseudoxanthomonas kalamensis DSM 18571]